MFRLDPALKVYLHREPVDFRRSINGPCLCVIARLTFTPNSYGLLALPLTMHSTSGACSAYSLPLSCGRWRWMRLARCSHSSSLPWASWGSVVILRWMSLSNRPRIVRWRLSTLRSRLNCLAWA